MRDGQNVYLGNPTGLVLHFPHDKMLYHMDDTDMALSLLASARANSGGSPASPADLPSGVIL
jgi:hypothetical protein